MLGENSKYGKHGGEKKKSSLLWRHQAISRMA